MILEGNNLETLKTIPDKSVNCCITSPPYFGLRDYGLPPVTFPDGWAGEHGKEPTIALYVRHEVDIFREIRRVLRDDGTLWLNLGDSYAGSGKGAWDVDDYVKTERKVKESYRPRTAYKNNQELPPKNLIGIPWRVAFALQSDGWILRQDIIWAKPNPMPESVTDRCTKSHEYIFLFSKSEKYYFDNEAIKEPAIWADDRRAGLGRLHYCGKRQGDNGEGQENFVKISDKRNKRDVWTVSTKPYSGAHFATFPPDLIEPCILAGCPKGGIVLDPFGGSGTTGQVAFQNQRNYILCELNPEYVKLEKERISNKQINLI